MIKILFGNSFDRNIFWASRAGLHDPFFVLDTGESRYVFLNRLEYGAFAERKHDPRIKPVRLEELSQEIKNLEGEGSSASKLAYVILQKYAPGKASVQVPSNFPVDIADYLRSKNITVEVVSNLFPERAVKSPEEIQAIREACNRTTKAFKIIEEILGLSTILGDKILFKGEPLTSELLKLHAEGELLKDAMVNVQDLIISSGPQAAMPHHRGSGLLLPHTTIVCDIYPQARDSGFYSDMTRTYVKGTPSKEVDAMYEAVLDAHASAMKAVRPQVTFEEVHNVAADVLRSRGFESEGERGFTHGIGHGLGVEVHEAPFVRPGSQVVLEPGNVITIEPGLYYSEHGGVRIEDVVLVKNDGYELLSNHPYNWLIP